jgi:hypothetical protein
MGWPMAVDFVGSLKKIRTVGFDGSGSVIFYMDIFF